MTADTVSLVSSDDLADQVESIGRPLGLTARVHIRAVDSDAELGHRADEPVVMASVFKLPILLELCRRASAGELELQTPIRVPAEGRTLGPTGLSVMLDPVELSLRDLALLMMSVSDNAATDVILELVGLHAVNATLAEFGLSDTTLVGDCRAILDALAQAVGAESSDHVSSFLAGLTPKEQLAAALRSRDSQSLDPRRTNRSTAAETSRLLQLIWRDAAGPPEACAEVRRILGLQVWPHRLRAGFPESVAVAGKTGTLPFWRNEAGVVALPDGDRYAVAVYCESEGGSLLDPDADRAIGRLARLGVDQLRSRS